MTNPKTSHTQDWPQEMPEKLRAGWETVLGYRDHGPMEFYAVMVEFCQEHDIYPVRPFPKRAETTVRD